MLINVEHRGKTRRYSPKQYVHAANRLIVDLSRVPGIDSIVLFGSIVKQDTVEAWSDIDVIIFVDQSCHSHDLYVNLRTANAASFNRYAIGVGIDVVIHQQFTKTGFIPGRPRYFTFDVAAYGRTVFGERILTPRRPTRHHMSRFAAERFQMVSAELHSWRRTFSEPVQAAQTRVAANAASTVKTALKLLQY